MSITIAASLLQAALMLLTLVQSTPDLPQSARDNAIQVTEHAIREATIALTRLGAARPATAGAATLSITNMALATPPGMTMTLQYSNMPRAGVRIINTAGVVVWTQELTQTGAGTLNMPLPITLPEGSYTAQAFGTDNSIYTTSQPYYFAGNVPASIAYNNQSQSSVVAVYTNLPAGVHVNLLWKNPQGQWLQVGESNIAPNGGSGTVSVQITLVDPLTGKVPLGSYKFRIQKTSDITWSLESAPFAFIGGPRTGLWCDITSNKANVVAGEQFILTWTGSQEIKEPVMHRHITGGGKVLVSQNGSMSMTAESGPKIIWFTIGSGGLTGTPNEICSVKMNIVSSTMAAPTVSMEASPSTLGAAQTAMLTWSSTYANRCTLQYDGKEDIVSLSGSRTVTPTHTTAYRFVCTNDPGSGRDGPSAETTAVITIAAPTCTLTTDKSSYKLGEAIVLQWASQNATYASFWQDTSGRDHLLLPGDKLSASGMHTITASVLGNPPVTLLIYNYFNNNACSVVIPVTQN
ncbi:MAG: hypothetical protein G01um10148_742 [Parcubacteria group bacterium Gr01-1014_8]|nr:MAG: hypothetical protein G01um10148_742 [Parcubacteria group bacterium Gr01-1014_8]